jgi:hypothetical protein
MSMTPTHSRSRRAAATHAPGEERYRGATGTIVLALLALLVVASPIGAPPSPAQADARSDYLIRLLQTSSTFRVRAQAALSLGRVDAAPEVVAALSEALEDEHASVRTAAAASLAELEEPDALPALRSARNDRDRTVRNTVRSAIRKLEPIARRAAREDQAGGDARFYVGVGMPGSRVDDVDASDREALRDWLRGRVGSMDGVLLAPADEAPAAAARVVRRRRLTGYFIDSSVVSVRTTEVGVRAEVSVVVNTYPGRSVRAMLSGAATVQGASDGPTTRLQAIRGALSGALRRLPEAFAQSGANGG